MRRVLLLIVTSITLVLSSGCTFKHWRTKDAEGLYAIPSATEAAKQTTVNIQTFDYIYSDFIATSGSPTNDNGAVTESFLTGTLNYDLKSKDYRVTRDNPSLTLVGHAYASTIDFSNFWSDLGINIASLITIGSVGSTRYLGGASLHVYSLDGKELTCYSDEQSWNYKCIGTPLSILLNKECFNSSAKKNAATLASMNCLRLFLSDLNRGKFDKSSQPE